MSAFMLDRRGTQIPTSDAVLMCAVVLAGTAAASLAQPALWYLTPVVVGCLLVASKHGSTRRATGFPEEIQAMFDDTIAKLPAGSIRALYSDIITAGRPVFARRLRRSGDDVQRETREAVTELLTLASQVALDATRLDMTIQSGAMTTRNPAVLVSAGKARAQYTLQLEEVVATLNAVVASGLAHGTAESERVSELVTQIRDEAEARSEAWKEIDALLA
jgi:hypothetical protein